MQLNDLLILDASRRRTRDGYLVADARTARTGIQNYLGSEVGKPDMPVVRLYRPETEVFSKDALATYAHKPITNGHPADGVSAENWRDVAVGSIGDEITRDGEFVRIPMMIADADAIRAVDAGRSELSAGYTCDIEWTPGQTPAGEIYDGVQRSIRINHVALVDAGRAGSACRIGDRLNSASEAEDQGMTLQKVTVDGITVEMSDTAAQVVSKLQASFADASAKAQGLATELADAKTAHQKALEGRDGEVAALKDAHKKALEAKDGEITAIKAQIPDGAKLDALAASRAELIGQARAALGDAFDHKGKSDADIRKAVVSAALGDAAKDMTDAQVEGAFRVVASGKIGRDPIRDTLRSTPILGDERTKAFAERDAYLTNAWQGTQKEAH